VILPRTDCLSSNAWICGKYLSTHSAELTAALRQHITLTVISLVVSIAVSFPIGLVAYRFRYTRAFILGASTALYTIPSLALFSILLPITGLTEVTVVIGLVIYALTIIIRTIVAGLDSVPSEVEDAARGMGYGPTRMLFRVQLPLAMPIIFGGIRIATVSTVALVTVGFIVGYGGLGNLIQEGLQSFFKAEVLTASVLCVLLAVIADLIVVGTEWVSLPWHRGR
jgi:osmoprotectant transport system permease protein